MSLRFLARLPFDSLRVGLGDVNDLSSVSACWHPGRLPRSLPERRCGAGCGAGAGSPLPGRALTGAALTRCQGLSAVAPAGRLAGLGANPARFETVAVSLGAEVTLGKLVHAQRFAVRRGSCRGACG